MGRIVSENAMLRFDAKPTIQLSEAEPLELLAASCHVILEDILRAPLELTQPPITVELEALQGPHHDLRQDIGVYPPNGIFTETLVEERRINLQLTPQAAATLCRTAAVYEVPYGIVLEAVTAITDIELCHRALDRSGENVQQEIEIIEDAQELSEQATRRFFSEIPERRVEIAKQSFRSREED